MNGIAADLGGTGVDLTISKIEAALHGQFKAVRCLEETLWVRLVMRHVLTADDNLDSVECTIAFQHGLYAEAELGRYDSQPVAEYREGP